MNLKHKSSLLALFFYSAGIILWGTLSASAQDGAAKLESVEGEVSSRIGAAPDFTPAAAGQLLNEGDVIKTGRHARASIVFSDGFLLRLAGNTTLQIRAREGSSRNLSLENGEGYFFSREPKNFPVVASPAVTTAVRGTEFVIKVKGDETVVSVFDGSVECSNDTGSVQLKGGEQAVTQKGSAPVKSIMVNQADAVQWAIAYPPLINSSEIESIIRRDLQGKLEHDSVLKSFQQMDHHAKNGDIAAAIRSYETIQGRPQAVLSLYAAELYLAAGDVENASRALDSVDRVGKTGAKGDASLEASRLAMLSIIPLSKGDAASAEKLAKKALEAEPNNSSALLANAYINQSRFDLDGAARDLRALHAARPNDALVLAKLAEIELGFGRVSEAEELLDQALAIDPQHPFVLSVYGYLQLIKDNTDDAKDAFNSALKFGPDTAVAHLGLGLALVRKGELQQGRAEIQRAAFLDPMVAAYRSYLGKAYFEEESEDLAFHEYERAIELDPNDPTPYLYRAYSQLSANKPVDALQDVERSIELNNSRAVYRSSLLLDQDLGVRSAGLAEVFTSLGFTEAARIEAIKSLNRDYTNFSAHRLLADSYQTILLNDAGLSEDKLAQLLAPLSFNLFDGPSNEASINDYNALFDRNEIRTELGTTLSSNDDLINPQVSQVGKFDKFGYLLSYDADLTGGSKQGNFSQRQRGTAALQFQPTYEDRFLASANGIFRDKEDDLEAIDESEFEDYSYDIGYVRRFGPQSKLLTQATYSDEHHKFLSSLSERLVSISETVDGETAFGDIDALVDSFSREKVESVRGTAQWVFDSEVASFVLGSQYYSAEQDRKEDSPLIEDSAGLFTDLDLHLASMGLNDLSSYDVYTYTTLHASSWADITLGINFSELELEDRETAPFLNDTRNRSKAAPKFGVTVYPTDSTTLRASYFESLRKSSFEDTGSLEPTLVGGINQRFTDFPGAESRNVGVGLDHKFSGSTYFGVEGVHRDVIDHGRDAFSLVGLDFDDALISTSTESGDAFEAHSDQDYYRTYVYQVLTKQIVTTLDYTWSDVEEFDSSFELETHKISGGLRYFSDTGIFVFGVANWREQSRQESVFGDGSDDFWTVDGGVGYRIPKRHGAIILQINNLFDQEFTYDQSQGIEDFVDSGFGVTLAANVNF